MANEHSWKSPYHRTPATGRFLGYYVHRSITPHPNDTIFPVAQLWVARPDLMALDLYSDPDLWMVIPLRNALQDPVYDLTLGRELIVPPLDHALKALR